MAHAVGPRAPVVLVEVATDADEKRLHGFRFARFAAREVTVALRRLDGWRWHGQLQCCQSQDRCCFNPHMTPRIGVCGVSAIRHTRRG